MHRYIKHGLAYMRGLMLKMRFTLFHKNCHCGKFVRVMKGSEISLKKGSRINIGDRVSIGESACISALNGGEISIGNYVGIGNNCRIISHKEITIGEQTIIAPNVQIYDHDHEFGYDGIERKKFRTSAISIGKNSWIAINNVILRGTQIGDRCVIGTGCVVKGCVESGCSLMQKRENIIKKLWVN